LLLLYLQVLCYFISVFLVWNIEVYAVFVNYSIVIGEFISIKVYSIPIFDLKFLE